MNFDKLKKLEGTKKYVFFGCIIVIVIMFALLIFMRDTLFTQVLTITYPDKCVEIYKNGNLTTPICEQGRLIKAQQENDTLSKRITNNAGFNFTGLVINITQ